MQLERKAALLLMSTTLIWGSTFPTMKLAQDALLKHAPGAEGASGLFFMLLRFGLGGLIFLAVFPSVARKMTRAVWRDSFYLTLPGVLGIAMQFLSLEKGSSAMVAFLTSLTVVTVPLVGWIFLRERLSRALGVGGAISLVGVFILTNPLHASFGRPEIIALAGAFVFGVQIHLVNHLTRRHDPEAMTLGSFVHFTWTCALGLALWPEGRRFLDPAFAVSCFAPVEAASGWGRWAMAWAVPYHAVFATVIAFWIFMRWQREVPATRAAIIYCFEPVFAVAIGAGFGEAVRWEHFAGGGVILLGNLTCELLGRRADVPATGTPIGAPAPPSPPP